MISTGVSVGLKVQTQSIFVANSDMLSGTLNTAISDVLRYATCDYTDADLDVDSLVQNPKFTNKEYSIKTGYFFLDDDKHMAVSKNGVDPDYVPSGEDDEGALIGYLISEGVYCKNLTISNFSYTYNPAKKMFSGAYTIKQADGTLKKDVTFSYRSLVA